MMHHSSVCQVGKSASLILGQEEKESQFHVVFIEILTLSDFWGLGYTS